MSRGLVVGVKWYEGSEFYERVLAVPDARIRQGLDRLLLGIPIGIRPAVAQFFAPFLENNEPSRTFSGFEYGQGTSHYAWWKRAFIEEV